MNLITELHQYFEATDIAISSEERNRITDEPFDKIPATDIIPQSIMDDRRLCMLLQCAGIITSEAQKRFFAEMYYLYLRECFK